MQGWLEGGIAPLNVCSYTLPAWQQALCAQAAVDDAALCTYWRCFCLEVVDDDPPSAQQHACVGVSHAAPLLGRPALRRGRTVLSRVQPGWLYCLLALLCLTCTACTTHHVLQVPW